MREADERALAEMQAAHPELTEDELNEYRALLALIPDEIQTRFVRRAD